MSAQEPEKNPGHRWEVGHEGTAPSIARNELAIKGRQQEMIRLLLDGGKIADVAMLIGVSKVTVHQYLKDPWVREQLAQLNSQLLSTLDVELLERSRTKAEIIDELAMLALTEMRGILQDKSAHIGVRAKMIDSILDRTPELSRTKKLDVTNKTFSMKAEDLLAAANAAREIEQRERLREAEEAAKNDNEQDLVRE